MKTIGERRNLAKGIAGMFFLMSIIYPGYLVTSFVFNSVLNQDQETRFPVDVPITQNCRILTVPVIVNKPTTLILSVTADGNPKNNSAANSGADWLCSCLMLYSQEDCAKSLRPLYFKWDIAGNKVGRCSGGTYTRKTGDLSGFCSAADDPHQIIGVEFARLELKPDHYEIKLESIYAPKQLKNLEFHVEPHQNMFEGMSIMNGLILSLFAGAMSLMVSIIIKVSDHFNSPSK